jgi:hypothetical protein
MIFFGKNFSSSGYVLPIPSPLYRVLRPAAIHAALVDERTSHRVCCFAAKTQGKKDKPQIMNWKPPPAGFVKANVDAAFNAEKQQGAIGVVIWDENRQVVAAKCKWYSSVPDVLTANAFVV